MSQSAGQATLDPSPRSLQFRHSVHEIPTPSTRERPPRYEPFILKTWVVALLAFCMIGLGITIEVALHISNQQNGFYVPEKNVFSFVSTQFLTSFFPTLLIVPLAYFWSIADWMLRWYQPYIALSEGNASASRSVLLDYIALNQLFVLFYSFKYKHHLVYVSTLTALTIAFLQPLAGALLQVSQVPHTSDTVAISTRAAMLSPDISQLNSFLAAAGYAAAAVYSGLGDPPFVHDKWTAAWFQPLPGTYLNGTLAVNTTGIQTSVNCINPTSVNLTASSDDYVALAAFPNGCSASLSFQGSDGNQQYSVLNASNCATGDQDITFQPVVFWYYFQDTSNSSEPQVAAVYCSPTMKVFIMSTSMDLNDGSLGNCTILDDYLEPNNVTGSPLNGQPYNGVVFDQSDNAYVQARAVAINSGLPGTVYKYASQQPNGLQSVYDDPYGWLNATNKIYTQHLAIAAEENYFGHVNQTIPAVLTTFLPRLFVESLPAHLLATLMILIGIVGLVVHVLHARARRKLWLTSPPGSIASIVSMTSRSGFGERLLPYYDERQLQENLTGLKFGLDERTGAIIADMEPGFDDKTSLLGHEGVYRSATFGGNAFSPLSADSFGERNMPR